jgi:hypothetical protein
VRSPRRWFRALVHQPVWHEFPFADGIYEIVSEHAAGSARATLTSSEREAASSAGLNRPATLSRYAGTKPSRGSRMI